MTDKEKAEAYDKALEKAKDNYNTADSANINVNSFKNTLIALFPELKESKDEKTRKAIISGMTALKDQGRETFATIPINDCITWLKRQVDKDKLIKELGEYKVKYTQEVLGNHISSVGNKDDEKIRKALINTVKYYHPNESPYMHGISNESVVAWLEKQKNCIKLPNSAYTSNKDVIEFADKYSHAIWENLMTMFKKIENYSIGCNDVSDIVLNAIINTYNWLEKQGMERKQLYIRFGDIPSNGKSKIYQGEEEIGDENGVSVYPAFELNGNIVLGLTLPITKTTLYTQQHLIEYDNRPCYLVNGDYIGKDTDGQPLINNVSIIKKIDSYRVKEENQTEQEKDILEDAILDGNEDGLIAETIRYKHEKQSKQKSAEWSEEDKDYYDAIIAKLEITQEDASLTDNQMDFLKSLRPQKYLIPSKEEIEKAAQEWDSKANFNPFYMTMENGKPTGVKQSITTHKESFKAGIYWILKSLKGGVQLQWKPSELQLGCLSDAIEYYNSFGYPAPKLRELLDDLKKLKEGKV